MNIIKKLFVNGKWSKLSKDALADDVSSSLLPPATAEDEGKVVSVTETGEYGLSTVESGLPVATAEDVGKVVSVGEDGSYELAEAGGSETNFYCEIFEERGEYYSDKTFSELVEAHNDNKRIIGVLPTSNSSAKVMCVAGHVIPLHDQAEAFTFYWIYIGSNPKQLFDNHCRIDENGISVTGYSYSLTEQQ